MYVSKTKKNTGDTGGGVLDGFADCKNSKMIVLYPHLGISSMQEKQIKYYCFTYPDKVLALGVENTDFDYCQSLVKSMLNHKKMNDNLKIKNNIVLSSANSINFGRLLPQMPFAFAAYFSLCRQKGQEFGKPVNICVPTGNFGNILGLNYVGALKLCSVFFFNQF